MNFVVLSSSRGTTLQAVIDAMGNGELEAECLGLIADKESRGCVAKARAAHLPLTTVEREEGEDRESYDKRLHEAILELGGVPPGKSKKTETVIAALGWMFILSPWFVKQWKNRILNVHPALLPNYPGAHAIEDALQAGESESGMTIHLIDEGVDTGPILVQKKCAILPADTSEELKDRIQELEKEWYPKVLQQIETGALKLPH